MAAPKMIHCFWSNCNVSGGVTVKLPTECLPCGQGVYFVPVLVAPGRFYFVGIGKKFKHHITVQYY